MDSPVLFICDWNVSANAQSLKVYLRADTQASCTYGSDELFGVDIRFPSNRFKVAEETFDKLRNRIYANSKNLMQVTTSFDLFRVGAMYITVLCANHGYNPAIVTRTLNFLLNEVFPDLAKAS